MKNKKLIVLALLSVGIFGFSKAGYPWSSTGGDGGNYTQIQEIAVFLNNSGGTLSPGDVVILDTGSDGDIVTGTTLGSAVRVHNANIGGNAQADSILVIGVVKSTSSDNTPVAVVTKGPVDTTCADSSDAVTIHTAVGVSGLAGQGDQCGGGTNLGIALESGAGTDADGIMIWVDTTGAD